MQRLTVILSIGFALLLLAATVFAAAGSVTETIEWIPGQSIKKVIIDWVSGTAAEGVPDGTISPLNGKLLKVESHVNGTINPTADYDLALIEHLNGSLDIFHNNGSNMAIAGETFYPAHYNGTTSIYPVYSATPLTFIHNNSTVNSAAGEVILYVEVPK